MKTKKLFRTANFSSQIVAAGCCNCNCCCCCCFGIFAEEATAANGVA